MNTIEIVFSAAGGVLALLGLVMLFREIADDRRRGQRLLERLGMPTSPSRSYPPPVSELFLKQRYVYQSERQKLEQIPRLEAEIQKVAVRVKKAADAELDRAMLRVHEDLAARDAELREGLRYVLAGSATN